MRNYRTFIILMIVMMIFVVSAPASICVAATDEEIEAAKNAYEGWIKTSGKVWCHTAVTMIDISGDGIPELILCNKDSYNTDLIATYRDGSVHVVDSVTSSYIDGKLRNSELLYNTKRHTIIAHTHTYTLKKKHQTLKGDFWVETQYNGNMSSKKVLKTVFNDGKRTWLLKGALKDHKIISEKKKALTKEIKRLKRGSVPASKSDSEGIIICEGTMSCVESIGISNNQFHVKFEKDVDVIDYNSYGKPISTTNEVVAPLASNCKWTYSSILLPDIYYFEDYSFDKIKAHIDEIHAEGLYEMSLRIFIKDGTVIRVDIGND